MKMLIRTLYVALAVSLPITVICLGANITTRMPDVYQYEFKSTDSLKDLDFDKNDDEMGEFISGFMLGKEKVFQIIGGDEDRPQDVFTLREMSAAERARFYMNIVAAVGGLMLVITVAAVVVLKVNEMDKEIRNAYKMGAFVYAGLLLVYFIGFFAVTKAGHSVSDMLLYVPQEEDVLPQIITDGLTKRIYFSVGGVSTVIMLIVGYGLFKLTAPKRIFSRN